MIRFFCMMNKVIIPQNLNLWNCTRIDITRNYDMGSLQGVLDAIDAFKLVKVGRQKCSTEDTTVSWGRGSDLHCGTIYAKGPQSRKLFSKSKANFTPEQLRITDRLLRAEYSLRSQQLRRLKSDFGLLWHMFTPDLLIQYHTDYFSKFISNVEVVDMGNILDLLIAKVGHGIPTHGQATSAYDCYLRCREKGFQNARASYPKQTFSRHLKNLSTIGVGPADLQPSNVVPLRRRQVVLDQPVSCWDDIQLEAKG
jgi:II/X family phage/plasmid replication protein